MMKFEIMSKVEAQRMGTLDRPLISITDVSEREPNFNPPWKDVLRLKFVDLCPEECKERNLQHVIDRYKDQLFTEDHALKIFDFIAKHSDCKVMGVHCHAGISRSSAVASFLASKFGEIANQKHFEEICRPNPHVFRVLEKVYRENIEK